MRTLAAAIANGELLSHTLECEAATLEALLEYARGPRLRRRALKSALVQRRHFRDWCEWRGIGLPQFWFPAGWQLDTELSEHLAGRQPVLRARLACQQIAAEIWQRQPWRTLDSVAGDDLVQTYGGARRYPRALVRQWLLAVAPGTARGAAAPLKRRRAGAIAYQVS